MVELNLYKVAALLIGAVIALAIDEGMGIEWKSLSIMEATRPQGHLHGLGRHPDVALDHQL